MGHHVAVDKSRCDARPAPIITHTLTLVGPGTRFALRTFDRSTRPWSSRLRWIDQWLSAGVKPKGPRC